MAFLGTLFVVVAIAFVTAGFILLFGNALLGGSDDV